MKHQIILVNLWQAFGTDDTMHRGLFCPIHFRKALDSVTHTYAETFFRMMHISAPYASILPHLF